MTMFSQNELETRLIDASKNPGQSYLFYEVLLKSDIYFLPHTYQRPLSNQEQLVDTSASTKISIMQIEIDGKVYIPFFLLLKELRLLFFMKEHITN